MGEGYQVLGSSFTATIMIKPIFFALTLALAGAFPAEIKPEALLVQQIVKEVPYHMPINQAYHMPFDQQYHLQANANRFGNLEVPTGSKNQVQKPIVYVLLNSIPQNIAFLRPS